MTRMARISLLFVVLFLTIQVIAEKTGPKLRLDRKILQESVIETINNNAESGWKASMNLRFTNYTVGQFMHLLGVKPMPETELKGIPIVTHKRGAKLPKKFDARTAWSKCSTITNILDQGHCGSCWAFGAVEALSDRYCIQNGVNVTLSVNDLLACCGINCGSGCEGGYPLSAWKYFVKYGVVTEECDPYFDQVGCSHPGCEPMYPTPNCVKKCQKDNLLWQDSKHFAATAYKIDSDPYSIMAEVFKNGPVEVSFTVYEDFAHYKSGVYKHITGDQMGGHAVKLIGWGTTEKGEDYWLLANSWNRSWGEDGYFKMRRGSNECGIEDDAIAGSISPGNLIKKNGLVDPACDA